MLSAALVLVLAPGPAPAYQIPGQTATQRELPTQGAPQSTPLPAATPAREYQSVDKPPVKTLDIPDCDLVGEIRNVNFFRDRSADGRETNRVGFHLALKNEGKAQVKGDVPLKVRLVNNATDTQFREEDLVLRNQDIKNDYWIVNWIEVRFIRGSQGAPYRFEDVKLIVDIDPGSTLEDDRRCRANNHCEYVRAP